MQYNITLKSPRTGKAYMEVVVDTPDEVFRELEFVGDEYNFEAKLWAEDCEPGDHYEDAHCFIVSLLDSRFC